MARDLLEYPEIHSPLFRTALRHAPMIAAIADNYEITVNHPGILVLDPSGGNKDVILPIEETPENVGLFYWIINNADAAESLVIKNNGETETIMTLGQGAMGLVYNDGTADTGWRGMVVNQGGSAFAATATADGLTTGLIPAGTGFVSVTSAAAGNIITLPSGAAANIGAVIKGWVGANGCEIRTPAASGATINAVDSDGTNEAAIPATTLFELTLVAADTWILRAWTELGAVITAIVPDAA